MIDLLNECLNDLEVALQWLELPRQQRPSSWNIKRCRDNLLTLKSCLAAEVSKKTPLKWLNLRTGTYNSLMRADCKTIESVSRLTPAQLLAIPRIGVGGRDEVIRALERWRQEPGTPARQSSYSEP